MDPGRDAKEYSWKYVTDAEVLCKGACDLLYAKLTPDSTVADVTLYNGEDDTGEVIIKIAAAGLYNNEVSPCVPIYCRRGLYVGTITTGDVLVQWRVRDSEEG